MELHRLIFRIDFRNAFSVFSRWGDILSYLDSSGFWPELGEDLTSRAIVASREDESKNKTHSLHVRVNDIDGLFEGHPISSPREYDDRFEGISYILNLLEVAEFNRLGVRFFFLQPYDSFESACRLFSAQVRPEYWALFERDPSDIAIVSVHSDGDESLRLSAGPLKRDEYRYWFSAPKEVKAENALLFDVDCYVRSYKAGKFDLRKIVALYYEKALSQAERALKFLESGG